nr:PREDICTED: peptidyl-prolyl cis-trans isomerase-like 6 [Latimeria chalumnae]|eukprot:XP_006006712.2 PREDICTED: peptidyl-prolyl cis-trans isomerase-like 6 [Latimeria chalumnae]
MAPPVWIQVVGHLKQTEFHIAKCIAEDLKQKFPSKVTVSIVPLLEFEWHEYLQEQKRNFKGEMWVFDSSVICYVDNQLLGNETALLKWAREKHDYINFRPVALYEAMCADFYVKYLLDTKASASRP